MNTTMCALREGQYGRVEDIRLNGHIRSRLCDLGLMKECTVKCLHRGGGIAAYLICGAVIAVRDTDASQVVLSL